MNDLEWGDCELDPEPDIRKAELSHEFCQHQICRGVVNDNPAVGSWKGLPSGFGFQHFSARGSMYTSDIFDSLDAEGQPEPALLWAVNKQVFVVYGDMYCMWSIVREKPLNAVIVDYDNRFEGEFRKIRNNKAIGEWEDSKAVVAPSEFGWAYGKWYRVKSFREL